MSEKATIKKIQIVFSLISITHFFKCLCVCVCVSNANKYTSAGVILYESTKPSFVTHDFILNTPSIDLLLNIYVAIVFLSFSPIPRNGRFIGSVGLSVYAVLRLIMRVCVVCRTYFYCKICAFPHAYYMSTHKRYCSIYANIAAPKLHIHATCGLEEFLFDTFCRNKVFFCFTHAYDWLNCFSRLIVALMINYWYFSIFFFLLLFLQCLSFNPTLNFFLLHLIQLETNYWISYYSYYSKSCTANDFFFRLRQWTKMSATIVIKYWVGFWAQCSNETFCLV